MSGLTVLGGKSGGRASPGGGVAAGITVTDVGGDNVGMGESRRWCPEGSNTATTGASAHASSKNRTTPHVKNRRGSGEKPPRPLVPGLLWGGYDNIPLSTPHRDPDGTAFAPRCGVAANGQVDHRGSARSRVVSGKTA
jgi:hypothetical protein